MADRRSLADEQEALVQARQDPAAFRPLYRAYFPGLYAYAVHHTLSVPDAEDLVSDIFLRAVQNLHRFTYRGSGSFSAWLYRIAHNLVHDQRRHRRNRSPLPLESIAEVPDSALLPENAVEQAESAIRLRQMLDTLPRRRREVIILKFFGGLRNREIAHVIGITERTVASHLVRGLDDLRRRYITASDVLQSGDSHEYVVTAQQATCSQ